MSKYKIGDEVIYRENGYEVKYGVITSIHGYKVDPSYKVEGNTCYDYSVNERHDSMIQEFFIIMKVGKDE